MISQNEPSDGYGGAIPQAAPVVKASSTKTVTSKVSDKVLVISPKNIKMEKMSNSESSSHSLSADEDGASSGNEEVDIIQEGEQPEEESKVKI